MIDIWAPVPNVVSHRRQEVDATATLTGGGPGGACAIPSDMGVLPPLGQVDEPDGGPRPGRADVLGALSPDIGDGGEDPVPGTEMTQTGHIPPQDLV